jgi:hypothetical protein
VVDEDEDDDRTVACVRTDKNGGAKAWASSQE